VMSWLALSPPTTPAQEKPQDIDRLIAELGSPETRENAKTKLIAIGTPALAPLDRALYHENPDVRVESQTITRILRRAAEIQPALAFVRAAIKIARARWAARDFTDFERAVRDAFDPNAPTTFSYVPRKTVGDVFDGRDVLTRDMIAALDRNDGILFLHPGGVPTDFGPNCLFTLPDKVGWTAYVIVGLQGLNLDGRANRNVNVAEGEADAYFRACTLAPQPGGGLKVVDADLKTNIGQMLKKGDLLRAVNGAPVATLEDLRPLSEVGPDSVGLTIDRDGKVFDLRIRVLRTAIFKKPTSETEARALFDAAERALAAEPDKALKLYKELLARYGATELVSKAKRIYLEERIADLEAKKR
jgi:hypothetical protein